MVPKRNSASFQSHRLKFEAKAQLRTEASLTGRVQSESSKYILDINGFASDGPLSDAFDDFGAILIEELVIRHPFSGFPRPNNYLQKDDIM